MKTEYTELIEKYNLRNTFKSFTKSEELNDGYKWDFRMIQAQYNIFVGGNSFDFTQSAYYTKEELLKDKKAFSAQQKKDLRGQTVLYSFEDKLYFEQNRRRQPLDSNSMLGYCKTLSELNKRVTLKPMNDEELLFAFRWILSDASFVQEMSEEDFINEMGYNSDYETMKKGERIYNQCKQCYMDLGYGINEIYEIMEELSTAGIE